MNPVLLDELIYLAVLPLLPVILHLFFGRFFTRLTESRLRLMALYILYIVVHILLHYSSLPALLLLAGNVGLILGLSLFYRGELKWRLYAALFISAVIILSDAGIPLIPTDNGYRLGLLLSKLLMLFIVLLLRRVVRGEGRGQPTGWLGSAIWLCPFLSIAALLQLSGSPFFRLYPRLFPVVPALLLAINVLIFILTDRVLSARSERSQRLLLEQQNSYYVNQYHRNREFQEEALRFRHDLNHILLGLRASVLNGEEAATTAELDALLGWTGQSGAFCNTGNPVIDSILDYKRREADTAEIALRLELNLPPRLMLDTAVISVILGNALDNALEAACQVPKESGAERYIAVHMHYLNDSLFIRIQNPYSGPIRLSPHGELLTTKGDKRAHGIGLRNMRQTIERAGGLFNLSYSGQRFQLELVLFHIERL
ncbi:sensor histidine kinase [Paenibacillus tritici]|uniref:ATP-binding protein n=1 Tax=Paenibacillus tritici TaxID=1873425 RepID=UPI001BACD441|nr:ATP-binding protein [Paenibacillus tritici]QUL55967.1 sensor histidine kinase [Paenibacillus tritici]